MGRDMFSYESNIKAYNKTLRKISQEGIPRAIAATLTRQAEITNIQARTNLKKKLVVRAKYTTNSLKVSESRPKPRIDAMYSKAGTISLYLPIQEEGGVIRARRKFIAVPTLKARIGGKYTGRRRPMFQLRKAGKINRGGRGSGGGKLFYMRPRRAGNPPGFFTRKGKKLIRIYTLNRTEMQIKGVNWFSDAVKKYHNRRFLEKVYVMEAKKEIARVRGVKR